MILHGNQRGGGRNLALHLLSDENDHVQIHEISGFIADNLKSALDEAYAVSKGTRAKQYLFSLSLNPPSDQNVSTTLFEETLRRAEVTLGLEGQPRAIVFHEKADGRRHCHAVWSRIDCEKMRAVPLPHTKRKLMALSRELYIENGWKMPPGMVEKSQRDPDNFTLVEWQQTKRSGVDLKQLRRMMHQCWAASEDQESLSRLLKERGYTLAKGDRRGVVFLDQKCEVYAFSRYAGIQSKDVKTKIPDADKLPSVDEARKKIATNMQDHFARLQAGQRTVIDGRRAEIAGKRKALKARHQQERNQLAERQEDRWLVEAKARQERFRKGFRGIFDRLTGKHRKIALINEQEALAAQKRDRQEKDTLIFGQLAEKKSLTARLGRLKTFMEASISGLAYDQSQYAEILEGKRNEYKDQANRHRTKTHGLHM